MRTIWDDTADGSSIRALAPPPPERLDPTPDVLVVGGGVVGLAVAAFCRRAGAERVLLTERERLLSGPSRSAAGLLSPEFGALYAPAPFVEAARRSLELHLEVGREWDTGCRRLDWLILVEAELSGLPPGVRGEVLSPEAVREAESEVGIRVSAIALPEQAAVHPLEFAAALARHAGTVATGVELTGFDTDAGRVTRVRTSAGDVNPGSVVFATGSALPEWAGHHPSAVKGHLIATAPAPFELGHALASTILMFQTPDRRLVAGGTLDLDDAEPDVRPDVVAAVREELMRVVPAARELPVEREWSCFRPATPDELPVVDRLPGLENAWMTVGHFRSGILMAPVSGEALARWITTGEQPAEVASFGLARFASTEVAP